MIQTAARRAASPEPIVVLPLSRAQEPASAAARRQRAIDASLLADFPAPARDRVMAEAIPIELPAGSILYRDDDDPRCALVVTGLVRAFLTAPDGRAVTVRYVRAGEMIGIPMIVGGPIPASIQLVSAGELVLLNARTLRQLAQTEAAISWLLAQELARRLHQTYGAVADQTFGSLRERVARHLLDLAAVRDDGRLVADVTQQALAEAVGSTRPAVARILGDLRQIGLVHTANRDIAILAPERLHAETWSGRLSPK